MFARLQRHIRLGMEGWLDRNLPARDAITLDRKKIFIVPSATGMGFLLLIGLIWLIGTNFANNLILAVSFLLIGFFLVAMLQGFANLSGISFRAGAARPAFHGELAAFRILLANPDNLPRELLALRFAGHEGIEVSLHPGEELSVEVLAPSRHRGWQRPGRLTVTSYAPTGLFRVWTHLELTSKALIYPQPVPGDMARSSGSSVGDDVMAQTEGIEDFVGLRRYQQGESRQRIAWKQFARGQGLMSKHYADPVDQRLWLDWDDYQGLDRETRLRRLCGRLMALSREEVAYGLRLPGIEIAPDKGEQHKQRLLRELALFELPEKWQ